MNRYRQEREAESETESGTGMALALLGGMALGALAMYLADPEQGRQRRALAQDAMRNMGERTGDAFNSAWRGASDRLSGLQQSATRLIGQPAVKPIDNHVLEARVRSKLARVASNAHAIEVSADAGRVTLFGPVVPHEREAVLDLVQSIPGVESVKSRLDDGGGMGDLGPALPLLAIAGGVLLGYYGLRRGGGDWLRTGANWLSNNMRGMDLQSMFGGMFGGMSAGETVVVERSIDIRATPESVFDVWTHYENFPHFMSHVTEVRDLGRHRSHWVVRGPGGTRLEWNSVLTRVERPHVLAWESEPGAMVENGGSIWLDAIPGGTRATVRMAYRPPAGALGKTVASMIGSDPESALEDDLVRLRNFIERGGPSLAETEVPVTTKGQVLH